MTSNVADMLNQASQDSLDWLIGPTSTEEFELKFYEQRLCLVLRDAPEFYSKLLKAEDLDTVLTTHNLRYPVLRVVRGDEDVPRESYTLSSGSIEPIEVTKRFDEGSTIVFNQLQSRVPSLSRLCVNLGAFFGSRVQTNIYLTPPNAQGFKPHWDTHDVFVLQVSGRKIWSIYDTRIPLPLKGQSFQSGHHEPGPVTDEFEMGPGSLLYIPRGIFHSARSTDSASLHITLGLTAFTWADLLVEAVSAAALENPSLRQNLPIGFTSGRVSPDEKNRLYLEKLALLHTPFDPAPVWQYFRNKLMAENATLFPGLLSLRLDEEVVTLNTVVGRRQALNIDIEGGTENCLIRCWDKEISLPSHVLPAIQFVMSTDRFEVRELPDCLDGPGKVTLVDRLMKEGLLVRLCVGA